VVCTEEEQRHQQTANDDDDGGDDAGRGKQQAHGANVPIKQSTHPHTLNHNMFDFHCFRTWGRCLTPSCDRPVSQRHRWTQAGGLNATLASPLASVATDLRRWCGVVENNRAEEMGVVHDIHGEAQPKTSGMRHYQKRRPPHRQISKRCINARRPPSTLPQGRRTNTGDVSLHT
jgi:hypothetical protein